MGSFRFHVMCLVLLVVLGSVSGVCAVGLTQGGGHGKVIYVSKSGTDRSEGLSPQAPKRNIKSAIFSANPGDTVSVAPGTYNENLVIDKNITITGNNPENTIIDGNHVDNCIYVQGGVTVKIKGLTMRNGIENENRFPHRFGGGICNSDGTVTVENSIVTNNTSDYGGGIYNEKGAMTLRNVTIKNNKADTSGGGIYNIKGNTMTIEDCLVMNNTVIELNGGGIGNVGKMTVKRSIIKNNHAHEKGGGIRDGGILIVEDSVVTGNSADRTGGGLYSPRYVFNTTITNNRAADGGGIYVDYECYVDDLSVSLMNGNTPNNFGGIPYIPA